MPFESFVKGVSSTCVFLLDFLDVHEDHSLGSADDQNTSALAHSALNSEGDFLGCLGFLPEDGLGLSSIAGLFAIVTPPSLGGLAFLSLFVLGDFVLGMDAAVFGWAEGFPCFRDHHHWLLFN